MTAARSRSNRQRGGAGTATSPPLRLHQDPRHAPREVLDEHGAPYVVGNAGGSQPWCPTTATTFKLVLTVRLSAAVWSIISDCDETFNYWEPLHFFLYGKGFQTWEYSPEFALRSYLYVLVHTLPAWIYQNLLQPHPMYVFFFLRCVLALVCSTTEVYFVNGVLKEVGANVARLTLAFLLFSSGMFQAGSALLPSTTSMYLTMLSYGAWFRQDYKLAIFFTALSSFLSWPFVAVLGVPIALDVLLLRGRWKFFLRWCFISTSAVLLPQVAIDSQYYGKTVVAPVNIVWYNVFTSHGPDLYGTEDWTFYLLNGFLNFNVVFLLALFVWPLQYLVHLLVRQSRADIIPRWLLFLGLNLWLAIFFVQSHKEERFLFPVYPLIALAGALAVDCLQKLFFRLFVSLKNKHYLEHTNWISVLVISVFSVLCASRSFAVYNNYSAPMSTWMHVAHSSSSSSPSDKLATPHNVCIGKEWHRFPSSFFLPTGWELKFLKSEFRGQLPQPYLSGDEATREVRATFNDKNLEEDNRYEVVVGECDFLVDLDTDKETRLEPRYAKDLTAWSVEESFPFLLAQESHKVFRAFYVPFLSKKYVKYADYVVLRRKHPVKKPERKKKRV